MAVTVQSPPVSPAEAMSLLGISAEHTNTGRRNRALVAILWRVGLRPGEALEVSAADIDMSARTVRIGDRVAGMDDIALRAIQTWAEARGGLGLTDTGPFLSTLRGKPLSQAYVRELLPRLAARAGITPRVHAMGLRYACAAEMSGEGVPTEIIEAQLGIRPQSSVARYLPIPDDEDIVAAMASRTPPPIG